MSFLGSKRNIGSFWAFVISILFSPVIGLIVILLSKRKDTLLFEKSILDKVSYKPELSYVDEMFKLKTLHDSGAINNEKFLKEKKRLDDFDAGKVYLFFFDSKGRELSIELEGNGVKYNVPINKANACVLVYDKNEFKVTVSKKSAFFSGISLNLSANSFENYYDLSKLI